MYKDKIEIWPEENRAAIVYDVRDVQDWPKCKTKYKKLLSNVLSYDIKEWTFGSYKTVEQSVMVEW